jgi:arginine/lysine/ornithine decarboxylase
MSNSEKLLIGSIYYFGEEKEPCIIVDNTLSDDYFAVITSKGETTVQSMESIRGLVKISSEFPEDLYKLMRECCDLYCKKEKLYKEYIMESDVTKKEQISMEHTVLSSEYLSIVRKLTDYANNSL